MFQILFCLKNFGEGGRMNKKIMYQSGRKKLKHHLKIQGRGKDLKNRNLGENGKKYTT